MKHLLIIPLLCLSAITAQGQFYVSANLGVSTQRHSLTQRGETAFHSSYDEAQPSGTAFSVEPLAGMCIGERFEAGIAFGHSRSSYDYAFGTNNNEQGTWARLGEATESLATYSVAPYLRGYLFTFGKWTLSAELSAGYEWGDGSRTETEYRASDNTPVKSRSDYATRGWEVALTPVFTYGINDHLSIDIYLDLLTLGYERMTTTYYAATAPDETARTVDREELSDGFTAGLNAYTGTLLTVGFAYTF